MKLINKQIQYIEFLTNDNARIKAFYSQVFGWVFTDYGPDYTAFEGMYVDGGFAKGDPKPGSVRVVLYGEDLPALLQMVEEAGGTITKPIFAFPGGKRFEFTDPDGNALAVWSEG